MRSRPTWNVRSIALLAAVVLSLPLALSGSTGSPADAALNLGPNLLDHNEATVSYSASGWTAQGNTTVSRTTAVARGSGASLRVRVDASGPWPDGTRTARVGTQWGKQAKPAQAGQEYYGSVWVRSGGTKAPARCELRFFRADGVLLDTAGGTMSATSPQKWTKRSCRAFAPATTAFVNLRVFLAETTYGNLFYVDDALLAQVLPEDAPPVDDPTDPVSPPPRTANLLTGNRATFDTSTGGWSAQGNTKTGYAGVVTRTGNGSLRFMVDASGPWPDATRTARVGTPWSKDAYAVRPGDDLFGSMWMRSHHAASLSRCEVRFFDGNGGIVDTVPGDAARHTVGTWAQRVCSATAPAGARYANLRVFVADTDYGNVYHVDDAFFGIAGAGATPPPPPTTPPTTTPPTTPPPTTPPPTTPPPTTPPPTTAPPTTTPPSTGVPAHGSAVNASNTGFDAYFAADLGRRLRASDLRVHNGTFTTSRDGQVIERMQINGNLYIAHQNVTIRASLIRSPSWAPYAISTQSGVGGQTVEYVDIDGMGGARSAGINGGNATLRFNEIYNIGAGAFLGSNSVFEYNYIHDLAYDATSHNTATSVNGWQPSMTNILIRRNHMADGNSSAFAIYSNGGPNQYIDVIENYFNTGNAWYQVQGGYHDSKPESANSHHLRFIGNRFAERTQPYNGGQVSPVTAWNGSKAGNAWSSNVMWPSGRPALP